LPLRSAWPKARLLSMPFEVTGSSVWEQLFGTFTGAVIRLVFR
jgi:hypothetical protein